MTEAELRAAQFAILQRLADAGNLTKEAVLDEARKPDSPLHNHPAFDWDQTKAATHHWLDQARRVIREFRIECTIQRGKIIQTSSINAGIKQGRKVVLRQFHPVRQNAELPTPKDEPEEHEQEDAPDHEVSQRFVTTADLLDDRPTKIAAAATFFRTLRGFRAKCYLYEDIDRDFKVIAAAIDRISERLEAGEFGAQPREEAKLPLGDSAFIRT